MLTNIRPGTRKTAPRPGGCAEGSKRSGNTTRPRASPRALEDYPEDGAVTESTSKSELRAELLARRSAMSSEQISAARLAVRNAVLNRAASAGWRRVAAYRPMRTEPGSLQLLDVLAARGVEVLVPIVLPDRDLDWSTWPDNLPLGADAIASVDAAVVPALAVDPRGGRLGRGGGSYDRALRRLAKTATAVALVYDHELLPEVPADPWDVRVTAVTTPSGWRDLSDDPPANWTGNTPGVHHG
jgi:5-formyltetrahydrofolate cyclo-ligase